MVQASNPPDLFGRWLVLVYLPLGLLGVGIALLPFGLLPGWATWLLVLLTGYSVLAVRLLMERRKKGLGVPLPRRLIAALAALSGMAVAGLILFVLGMDRLTSPLGMAMAALGAFFMMLSVTIPLFRMLDIVLRGSWRLLARMTGRRPATPRRPAKAPPAARANPTVARPAVRRTSGAAAAVYRGAAGGSRGSSGRHPRARPALSRPKPAPNAVPPSVKAQKVLQGLAAKLASSRSAPRTRAKPAGRQGRKISGVSPRQSARRP